MPLAATTSAKTFTDVQRSFTKTHADDDHAHDDDVFSGTKSTTSSESAYQRELDCRWVITAPEGHKIHVNFHKFNTEKFMDEVSITDGNGKELHVLHGDPNLDDDYYSLTDEHGLTTNRDGTGDADQHQFDTVTSKTNELHIHFHSDETFQKEGFSATYWAVAPTAAPNDTQCSGEEMPLAATTSAKTFTDVQRSFTKTHADDDHAHDDDVFSGTKSTTSSESAYQRELDCRWVITAPEGHKIHVNFHKFNTEKFMDEVSITDGNGKELHVLHGDPNLDDDYYSLTDEHGLTTNRDGTGDADQHQFDTVTSKTNELHIHFHSDETFQKEGFSATYWAVAPTAAPPLTHSGNQGSWGGLFNW